MGNSAVEIETVYESLIGKVTRTTHNGRTSYQAAGRCIGNHRGDNFEYYVTISPDKSHPNLPGRFDSLEDAIQAVNTWTPEWRDHARDHRHAQREQAKATA